MGTAGVRDGAGFGGWERVAIKLDSGDECEGVAPVIISASRSTDIPAFYGAWFVERLKRGYADWVNPFSGALQHVSFSRTRAIVFWTKDPRPMMAKLRDVAAIVPNFYFLYTLNDYEQEGYEPAVAHLERRVRTFLELSDRLGPGRVVWRFDPLILSDTCTVEILSERVGTLARRLKGATDRLIVSFIDIARYPKVKRNLASIDARVREFTTAEKLELMKRITPVCDECGIGVSTCAEDGDLSSLGVTHNRCVDDERLRRLFGADQALMAFLGSADNQSAPSHRLKDPGQRDQCGCIASKDIGRYDTCPHLCAYCYANSGERAVALSRVQMPQGFPAALGARPGACSRCGLCSSSGV